MSRGVNKVILIGNVGKDPEVNMSENGYMVAKFSLATEANYTDKNTGKYIQQAEWHKIVAFGKCAQIAQQHVKKGLKIYVEGSLKTKRWVDHNIEKQTTEIVANIINVLQFDKKSTEDNDSQPSWYGNNSYDSFDKF